MDSDWKYTGNDGLPMLSTCEQGHGGRPVAMLPPWMDLSCSGRNLAWFVLRRFIEYRRRILLGDRPLTVPAGAMVSANSVPPAPRAQIRTRTLTWLTNG